MDRAEFGFTARAAADSIAQALNRGCDCRSLDPERLRRQLETEPALIGLAHEIERSRPHLFSATAVFMAPETLQAISDIIGAIETVIALPAYATEVLARTPEIARYDPGPRGVFMGFDFHLCDSGPQLIEINTNAGGAMLNRALARAQQACCTQVVPHLRPTADLDTLDRRWLDSFLNEWALQGRSGVPQRIAIVDEAPEQQYLHPEFLLFQHLFRSAGIDAVICDPDELAFIDGRLMYRSQPIDLVYNRLTDFYLQAATLAALRAAYEADAIVLTPHPRAHALHADKRNLALLTDATRLAALGAPSAVIDRLVTGIPRTVDVTPENAGALWAARRNLFFKPATGFGSRATYRGDKLTQRVWRSIVDSGEHVAQHLVPPSARRIRVDGNDSDLKVDIRAYAYNGKVQLLAARLYMGQTTNFRTPGGGFAPVFLTTRDTETSPSNIQ